MVPTMVGNLCCTFVANPDTHFIPHSFLCFSQAAKTEFYHKQDLRALLLSSRLYRLDHGLDLPAHNSPSYISRFTPLTWHGVEEGIGKRVDGYLRRILDLLLAVFFEGAGAELNTLGERQPRLDNVLLREVVKC